MRKKILVPFEVKNDEEKSVVVGLAAAYENIDRGGDFIMAGAFKNSLARLKAEGRKLPMLWQHESRDVIGVWEELAETSEGLVVKGALVPEVARAREAEALLSVGALNGLSIGYRVVKGGSVLDRAKGVRRLSELELVEISIVTFPMNDRARIITPKSFEVNKISTRRDMERALRDAGFSKRQAGFVAAGWVKPNRAVNNNMKLARCDTVGRNDGGDVMVALRQLRACTENLK